MSFSYFSGLWNIFVSYLLQQLPHILMILASIVRDHM